ncbi:MAG: glutamine amidotransferase [Clostridia bacterium]|nr:glutamine amidotransferase [Clostridia bacterium]
MKELKILYLYPDILDLYGDIGNIKVLKYRLEQRGIKALVDNYSIGNEKPDFKSYDIVFAGGGADNEQKILADDLIKYKEDIKEAIESGTFFLLICGAYQLFGKYYKGVEGNIIPGLEVFDYFTEANPNRAERCIGNIVVEANLGNTTIKVIGFENHGGQTYGIESYFGRVLFGNGNKFGDDFEGFMRKNVIATYLHGPLLSKNPELTDYIIKYCLERKYNEEIILEPLNDEFENKCRLQLLERFLKDKNL